MGFLNKIFGSSPEVPDLPTVDLPAQQQKAINANLAALPGAEKLTNQSNTFNREQILSMLRNVIPGFDKITSATSGNIESLLNGEIPADVSAAVQNSAAARSLGKGTAGSGMGRNLVARDLGLTSLDLTQKGISAAESWLKLSDQMFSPGMLNVSSMFITPQQAYAAANEQNTQQFQRDWMQSQVSAMRDPVLGGISDQVYGLMQSFIGGVGSTVGGGMGAGGGMGGGGGTSAGGGFFGNANLYPQG